MLKKYSVAPKNLKIELRAPMKTLFAAESKLVMHMKNAAAPATQTAICLKNLVLSKSDKIIKMAA